MTASLHDYHKKLLQANLEFIDKKLFKYGMVYLELKLVYKTVRQNEKAQEIIDKIADDYSSNGWTVIENDDDYLFIGQSEEQYQEVLEKEVSKKEADKLRQNARAVYNIFANVVCGILFVLTLIAAIGAIIAVATKSQ